MAHVRDQIKMTEDEIWRFLEEARFLQVATLNRDGSPHLTTMNFAPVERSLVFHTYAKSQKTRNIERDPRIAVLAESGASYAELRGVSINGQAEIVDDPQERFALALAVRRRSAGNQPAEELAAATGRMLEKRAVIRIRPEKVVSWDHRKLAALGRSY